MRIDRKFYASIECIQANNNTITISLEFDVKVLKVFYVHLLVFFK